MSSIEGYLLRIGDQSRVYVPEVSISPGLLCYQLPERGREELEYVARHYDHADPQHARIMGEVTTFLRQASESRRHQHDVEERLTDMRVDVCNGRRKGLDVFGEGVIRIGQSAVEVADSVVGLVPEVEQVGVVDKACSDRKRQLALEETDQTVDEGGRNGYKQPIDAVLKEKPRILFDDRFDDPSVELGHVDREKCS